MKVRTKLYLSISLLVFLFVIIFVSYGFIQRKSFVEFFRVETQEKEKNFDKIVTLKGKSLEALIFDYSYWDEMVNFIATANMAWAKTMIETSVLSNFNINAIWIYKTDSSLLYSINNLKDDSFKEALFNKEIINKLFSKNRFCHFFLNTPKGPMEIRGATVHPTFDVERKTPPQGYLLAARLWNKEYIDELSGLIGGTIQLAAIKKKTFINNLGPEQGIINFSRLLTDWKEGPLIQINIKLKSYALKEFSSIFKQRFIIFILFAGSILFIILFIFMRWVNIPLRAVSLALFSQDASYIDNLIKNKDEFGEISRLIQNFIKQREALQESEERYRLLAANITDTIWTMDMNLRFTYFSPSVERMRGFSTQEAMSQKLEEILTPESFEVAMKAFKEELANEEKEKKDLLRSRTLELRHKSKDGSFIWCEVTMAFIRDSAARAIGIIGVTRNISERKKAEDEIRALAQRIEFILGATKTGIDIIDSNFNMVYIDPEWQKIYGDYKGKKCYEYFAGQDTMCPGCGIPKALETKEPVVSEEILPREGNRPIQVITMPFQNENGEWLVAEVNVDITERKRAEKRLQLINECLLSLEADFHQNLQRITALCGELFGGTCVLYNRLEKNMLCSLGQWRTPADFQGVDAAEGHICYDVISRAAGGILYVPDLQNTRYAETDPNVRRYGLKTYIGHAVRLDGKTVGSLCVVFQNPFHPTEDDKRLLGILASALGTEEKRRMAEERLLASEIKNRTLLNNLPQNIFLKDKNSVYLSCNENYARDLKIKPEEIVGKTDYDFYPKELAEKYREDDARIMELGKVEDIEEGYVQDGQERFVHTVKTPIKNENGEPIGVLGFFWDITERKKVEEALQTSKELIETTFNSLSDYIAVIDPSNFKILKVNKAFSENLNLEEKDVIGKTCYELTHHRTKPCEPPDDDTCPLEETLRTGFHSTSEHIHYDKDGNKIFVEVSVYPMKNEKNQIYHCVHVSHNITERKKAEGQLRESEQKYRSVVDNIGIGVSLISPKMEILALNNQMKKWFPDVDVSKRPICYRVFNNPPREDICSYCQTCKTLQDGQIHESITETPLGDKIINFRVISSPVKDNTEKIIAAIEMVEDITSRKEMEKRERLAQLGELVADMAHEVNNPLMIISGNAQLSLMKEIQDEAVKDNLKIIFEECRRAKDIIQRLLGFSRPSKGAFQKTDINKSIEAVLSIIEHQFNLANIEIKRNYSDNLPFIPIDERQMGEVFMNLLNNARDAMPKGGIIEVATSLEGEFLKIDSKDTGCGMTEEVMERLFEPFFTTKDFGTGLGLSVCYGIIKAHNGKIKFESTAGKGTTVTILLPLREVE